jgi:hypothetical protein
MGIHISLVILVWGYTKHGDTHITVTPATDYPRASRSFPRIEGSGNEIALIEDLLTGLVFYWRIIYIAQNKAPPLSLP